MALIDEVQARYSVQQITELTNPQSTGSTTIDAARLQNAADDAEADFELYAQVVFDIADSKHIAIGVRGVIAKLTLYTNVQRGTPLETRFHDDLHQLAAVSSRKRISPTRQMVDGSSRTLADEPPMTDAEFELLIPDNREADQPERFA